MNREFGKPKVSFEKWWSDVGRHYNPCPEVPWNQKLIQLAAHAFDAGKTHGLSRVESNHATRKFVVLLGRIEKYLKCILKKEERLIVRLNLESDYEEFVEVLADLRQMPSEN